MTKKEFFEYVDGKYAEKDGIKKLRETIIEDCKRENAIYNENNSTNISIKVTDKSIDFSDGRFLLLPAETKGYIKNKSQYLVVGDCQISKSEITDYNTHFFCTKYSKYIIKSKEEK